MCFAVEPPSQRLLAHPLVRLSAPLQPLELLEAQRAALQEVLPAAQLVALAVQAAVQAAVRVAARRWTR